MNSSTPNPNAAYNPNPNSFTPTPSNRPPPQRAGSGSAPSTPTATGSSSTGGPSFQPSAAQIQAQEQLELKQANDTEKRDRTLGDFMLMLDDYEPLVSPSPSLLSSFISTTCGEVASLGSITLVQHGRVIFSLPEISGLLAEGFAGGKRDGEERLTSSSRLDVSCSPPSSLPCVALGPALHIITSSDC
jgi:hypothetical protein